MPSKNSSFLYFIGKIVYPKMPEDTIRYLALLMNSSSDRENFSQERIARLVRSKSGQDWSALCLEYTWAYSTANGGPPRESIPVEIRLDFDDKALACIESVENRVRTRKFKLGYERALRKIPQEQLMCIMFEFTRS